MVALFVALMLVALLTIDLVLMARSRAGLAAVVERQNAAATKPATFVGGFALAADRAYHEGHAWARFNERAVARVGIDDFAARLVGPADHVELPEAGRSVRAGDPVAVLRRRGRTAVVHAPVSGIVTRVNREAGQHPAAIARDPFGAGWLLEIKGNDLRRDLRHLAQDGAAHTWLDRSVSALHQVFAPTAALAAADGGRAVEGIADQMDDETWNRARAQFRLG